MGLESLFGKKGRPQRVRYNDELDPFIDVIERFAPRDRLDERNAYYYNYRMMGQYFKPLMALLETISQQRRLKEDQDAFFVELFLKLKAFYDIKDRLSMDAALEDWGLQRRYREIFGLFFGRQDLAAGCLVPIRRQQTRLQAKENSDGKAQED